MGKNKQTAEQFFRNLANEHNKQCGTLFRQNIVRLFFVWGRYILIGSMLWTLLYWLNPRISVNSYLVMYTMVFILLGIFSYLSHHIRKQPSNTEWDLDEDTNDGYGFFSIIQAVVNFLSGPARGTIEAFLTFGHPLFAVTSSQFALGMRLAHTLKVDISFELMSDAYSMVISSEELKMVVQFLQYLDLVRLYQRDDETMIHPTKKLQSLQQRFEPASELYPVIDKNEYLTGVISFLQEKAHEQI